MMKIDRRIVVNKPKSTRASSPRRQNLWTKRAVLRSVWDIRKRILEESGEDIFGLFVMDDCIEINIKGELETIREEDK